MLKTTCFSGVRKKNIEIATGGTRFAELTILLFRAVTGIGRPIPPPNEARGAIRFGLIIGPYFRGGASPIFTASVPGGPAPDWPSESE